MITVFLVRHADIDPPTAASSDNPPLNTLGRVRAQALAHTLKALPVSAIFTSSFLRTRQTVEPLAAQSGVLPREASSSADLARDIASGAAGAVVVVAGHSDTVPEIIAGLGAAPPTIHHREFDNLFVVLVGADEARLIRLKYGGPSA
jgi:broad specificity phosphatase PhoE